MDNPRPDHIIHCQSWMCPRKCTGTLTEPDGTLDMIAGAYYCTECGTRNADTFNKHMGVGNGWHFVPFTKKAPNG